MNTVEANALVQQSPEYTTFVNARRALESNDDNGLGDHYHLAYTALIAKCKQSGASGYALIQRGVQEANS